MKFTTEQQSVDYFIYWLKQHCGNGVNVRQSATYDYYDVEMINGGGKIIRYELKRRNLNHNEHNDAVMEEYKYLNFINDLRNGTIHYGYLVCFFNDIMTLSDVTKPIEIFNTKAKKTTEFTNGLVVDKRFVRYNQDFKINYIV